MRIRRFLIGVPMIISALALTACPSKRTIAEIQADPSRYYDKEVTVIGRVTNSYGAAGYGVYEIDDGTGRMWVYADKYGVPSKDIYVGVTGRVLPSVTFAGRSYVTAVRESKRRSRQSR